MMRTFFHPGAYSGSNTVYPKARKLKAAEGETKGGEAPSCRNWIPVDVPKFGGFTPTKISVITAAIPKSIPNFERNELPLPSILLSKLSEALIGSSGTASELSAPSRLELLILQNRRWLLQLSLYHIVHSLNLSLCYRERDDLSRILVLPERILERWIGRQKCSRRW